MEIRVFDTAEQVGQATAVLIASHLINKPQSVLGLATGSSPIPTYQNLIAMNKSGAIDFSQCVTYNLDEYVGIPVDHECSYHRFMDEELFNHVNIRREAIHVPDGNAPDMDAAAKAYDQAIADAGNIDVQLLGIGHNGHIGFNEPGDTFIYGCHVVDLTESTIQANTRFFASEADVPRQAMTMGIKSIMQARQILVVVSGKDKAEIVKKAFTGPVVPQVPASILQMHPNVLLVGDKDALSLL